MLSSSRRHDAEYAPAFENGHEGLRGAIRRIFARRPSPEERLERTLTALRRELDGYVARFEEVMESIERREGLVRDSRVSVERLLRRGTQELDAREAELVQLTRELEERESRLREAEAALERRRSELGAVELKRAALEQRERALDAREEAAAEEVARLAEQHAELEEEAEPGPNGMLLFVPGTSYTLVEIESAALSAGTGLEVGGVEYVVSRLGPSPLPSDRRRCAYLVRGAPRPPRPPGSS
jgi:hypothetical protein